MANRLQVQAAHRLHHPQNHPLAFINSLETLQRHFMISLQDFSDPSISGLLFRSTGFFHCAACFTSTPGGPSFHCLACPFSLSATCAALPLITVDNHPHPLLLLDRKSDHKHLICGVCDEGISDPSFVRCVHCDAFLHVQCCLPPLIEARNHHNHPIVLSMVVGYNNLCGVCGEERDGEAWFYCCNICPFLAHVGCVIYDLQNPSEKEGEEASITTQIYTLSLDNDEDNSDEEGSHENILKPGVTLQQILESFSESDDAEYQSLVAAMEKASGGGGDDDDDTENEANSEDKHSHYFSYLEKPLYDLIDKLELEDADPFQGFDRDSPTVLVDGGYLVLEKWAGVFTKVFTKYGDISESSNLGIKVRTVVWNLFCRVMEDMSRTKFENVTGEDLVSWMIGIRTIELAGFETEFAFEGWKKIAMAFFGAKAKDVAQELVDEKEEKIKEQRMKLENLCEEQEKLLSLREKCHIEALAMEDGTFVTDGFL
ncbi:hypothetical protein IC582_022176 [Cucumis melo]